MLDIYNGTTLEGQKVRIMLEECNLPYIVHEGVSTVYELPSDEGFRVYLDDETPVIVDQDGPDGQDLTLFGSGAILVYLAEKAGAYLPRSPCARYRAMQWLIFQVSKMNPVFSQAELRLRGTTMESIENRQRIACEPIRLYYVLEDRLSRSAFLGGNTYTIADIAAWPVMKVAQDIGNLELDKRSFPCVRRWLKEVALRPAVQRGISTRIPSGFA